MFTASEAETILREKWDDAEQVGGFANDWTRTLALNQLTEQWGDALEGFTLLGQTMWSDYEEGGEETLWVKDEDQSLWIFREGHTVHGDYGEDFREEIYPADLDQWLAQVRYNNQHADEFVGY